MAKLRSGLRVNGQCSNGRLVQLLNNIQNQKIDWSLVKISGRTERECQSRFQNLMKTVTSNDIEKVPFDRKKKSKAGISRPRQLFIKHKRRVGETKSQNDLSRQYTELEDTEKLKWIQMAINQYKEDRKILTKNEDRISKGRLSKITCKEKSYLIEMQKKKLNEEDQHVYEVEDASEAENVEQSNARMKRKRQEQTPQSTEQPVKKARLVDGTELARIPLEPYDYYILVIYPKWGTLAERTYNELSHEEKEKIREKFERYIESLPKDEKVKLEAKMLAEEQNDSSDPDDD